MAVKKILSPAMRAANQTEKRMRAEKELARRKDLQTAETYQNLVAAQTATNAAPAATQATIAVAALADTGIILRVPAGGRAELTVTGLEGWHYDTAQLTLVPYGRNMALPLTLEKNEPGPNGYAAAHALPLSPPLFIGGIICQYQPALTRSSNVGRRDRLTLTADTDISVSMYSVGTGSFDTANSTFIGRHVSKLTLNQLYAHSAAPWITAILPNTGEGLSISRDDDRVLHQVPRKLGNDDSAQSSDLSDYLNEKSEAGESSATFLIGSRTDCVLRLQLSLTRRQLATGLADRDSSGETLLSPWQPEVLVPNLPAGGAGTISLRADMNVEGPALTGLKAPATLLDCQGIHLPPRVSLLQRFHLPGNGDQIRQFSGVWLYLSNPPDKAETLQIDLADFDADTAGPGKLRGTVKADISPRQMDLQPIGDGIFAHWAAFETPITVDIPDLDRQFALVLRDASGPIPLLECAAASAHLSPALSRNLGRSDRWSQRRFGQPAKVLLFELGETTQGIPATLTAQSGAVTTTITFPEDTSDLALTLPSAAQVQLFSNRQITLSDLQISSSTAPETLG